MSINRGKVLVYKPKIYAAMFIILSVIIVDIFHLHSIQLDKRAQARDNLTHTRNCLEYLDAGNLTKDDMKTCANYMKTTITGDMYIVNQDTLYFEYDGSTDVPKDLYFTKESVGKYFTEWKTAIPFITHLKNNLDSTRNTMLWYNFDGTKEYLETKKYTTDNGQRLAIVQGAQSDEIGLQYSLPRLLVGVLTVIYVSWLITSAIGGRKDDMGRSDNIIDKR